MFVVYNWEGRWPQRVAGGFLSLGEAVAATGYLDLAEWVKDDAGGLVHKDGALRVISENGLRAAVFAEQEDYE